MKKMNLASSLRDGMKNWTRAVVLGCSFVVFLFVGIQVNAQTIPNLVSPAQAMDRIETALVDMAPTALNYTDESGITQAQFAELQVKYTLYKKVFRGLNSGETTEDAVRNNWVGTPHKGMAPVTQNSAADALSLSSHQANQDLMNELITLLK